MMFNAIKYVHALRGLGLL